MSWVEKELNNMLQNLTNEEQQEWNKKFIDYLSSKYTFMAKYNPNIDYSFQAIVTMHMMTKEDEDKVKEKILPLYVDEIDRLRN